MSNAAQAYARTSQTTASPREIEAQALLRAARQLQEVQDNWNGPDRNMHRALMFNRRLWCISLPAVEDNGNPNTLEVRQNIANLGMFVMRQTIEIQLEPDPTKLKSLIDIHCNIAAGLSGRAGRWRAAGRWPKQGAALHRGGRYENLNHTLPRSTPGQPSRSCAIT